MKKYLLAIAVILLAVGFSAFYAPSGASAKKASAPVTTLIWFEVDGTTGEALDPDGGMVNPPGSCQTSGSEYCSRALEYPGEVTYDGQYHIASGVDITTDYNEQKFKN